MYKNFSSDAMEMLAGVYQKLAFTRYLCDGSVISFSIRQKIFICIVLLALVGMQMAADNEAAEKDLDCAKDSEGKVIACKGKNPIYEETEYVLNCN